ncbi:TetR/AcrR family transcriptional regulator [Streptomonospora litoralis]|uniref:Transcriptional regulator, TetR family n=1 Tax=Streptomonospora litoralis TaxID=2498135 RepID=A0A4P6Q6X1_9ACTN|nr:TetR/AcrR family transcriptional regulator [Streptomonospora litoralis]QBI56433.1 Transcriptional regulator, TetR family [Streptomonospora litoralis]
MNSGEAKPRLRERTRRAIHREIAETGMSLFLEHGFEETTVDQIAEAAGISRRSFFRYFATKEDVVLGGLIDRGHRVRSALAERPPEEEPWIAVRASLLALRDEAWAGTEVDLRIARMLFQAPSLRARHLEKHLAWQDMLVPELTRRLRAAADIDEKRATHHAAAIIATALTCLDVATEAWVQRNGTVSLEDLWDEAVTAVRS